MSMNNDTWLFIGLGLASVISFCLYIHKEEKREKEQHFTKKDLKKLINGGAFNNPFHGPADEFWTKEDIFYN